MFPVMGILIAVDLLMIYLLVSIYRTRYVLSEEGLLIRAPIIVGGSKKVKFDEIVSVGRTLIPFGFRLFGASFYGGYYHIPSLGRTFMLITNFSDGVLIRSKNLNYIITPREPEKFMEELILMAGRGGSKG